jgi:hypothetical protein
MVAQVRWRGVGGGTTLARPRVFISSSYYDLKYVRASLDLFITTLGFESVLSENGDIAYVSERPLDESCYSEAGEVDLFVLIVGGRYGSPTSDQNRDIPHDFFSRYDSITRGEYETAAAREVPIYVLIENAVYAEYQTFRRNRDNLSIEYAHVESVNVFHLIDHIMAQPQNNPIQTFERASDIESWLRDQWAGLFREMLQRRNSERQLTTLREQVGELRDVNQTLKTYLEVLVKGIVPDQSSNLISSEDTRLAQGAMIRLANNPLITFVQDVVGDMLSDVDIVDAIEGAASYLDFIDLIMRRGRIEPQMQAFTPLAGVRGNRMGPDDLNKAREILGLPPVATDIDPFAHLAVEASLGL